MRLSQTELKCAFADTRRRMQTDFNVLTRELHWAALTCSIHLRDVQPTLAIELVSEVEVPHDIWDNHRLILRITSNDS